MAVEVTKETEQVVSEGNYTPARILAVLVCPCVEREPVRDRSENDGMPCDAQTCKQISDLRRQHPYETCSFPNGFA